MAKYDPTHPALCLRGKIIGLSQVIETYDDIDSSGMTNTAVSYRIIIGNINPQVISDESTRAKGQYNGIDVKVGDWISDFTGEVILQITKAISDCLKVDFFAILGTSPLAVDDT